MIAASSWRGEGTYTSLRTKVSSSQQTKRNFFLSLTDTSMFVFEISNKASLDFWS